jgi:hypothetical protein
MQRHYPPRIVEVIQPTEFVNDLDLQARIVNSRMMHDYVSVLLVFCLLLIISVVA